MANTRTYQHDPAITYTLDDFISMQLSDDLTYYNFSTIEVIDGVEHTDKNMFEEYIEELIPDCANVELSPVELKKYRYHPDLLAHALYGSVQLDVIIMMLNDMVDPKEFNRKNLILPYSSSLYNFLDTVYSIEEEFIKANRAEQGLEV